MGKCESCRNKEICMYKEDCQKIEKNIKAIGAIGITQTIFKINLNCSYCIEDKAIRNPYPYGDTLCSTGKLGGL